MEMYGLNASLLEIFSYKHSLDKMSAGDHNICEQTILKKGSLDEAIRRSVSDTSTSHTAPTPSANTNTSTNNVKLSYEIKEIILGFANASSANVRLLVGDTIDRISRLEELHDEINFLNNKLENHNYVKINIRGFTSRIASEKRHDLHMYNECLKSYDHILNLVCVDLPELVRVKNYRAALIPSEQRSISQFVYEKRQSILQERVKTNHVIKENSLYNSPFNNISEITEQLNSHKQFRQSSVKR